MRRFLLLPCVLFLFVGVSFFPIEAAESGRKGEVEFYWVLAMGRAYMPMEDSFIELSRIPVHRGMVRGQLRDFDWYFREQHRAHIYNRPLVFLEINSQTYGAGLLDPSVLKVYDPGDYEVLEEEGAIKQVLLENGLTHVDKLEGGGFLVRSWCRGYSGREKVNGFYLLPEKLADREFFICKPDGESREEEFVVVKKMRDAKGGEKVNTRHFRRDRVQDVIVIYDYEGEGIRGKATRKEVIYFSERGEKSMDYTIDRLNYIPLSSFNGKGSDEDWRKISHRKEVYRDFSYGDNLGSIAMKRKVLEVYDVGGEERSTKSSYYDDESRFYIHGRLRSVEFPDGKWEFYEYEDAEGAEEVKHVKYMSDGEIPLDRYKEAKRIVSVITEKAIVYTTYENEKRVYERKIEMSEDATTGGVIVREEAWPKAKWSPTISYYHSDEVGPSNPQHLKGRLYCRERPKGMAFYFDYKMQGENLVVTEKFGKGNRKGVKKAKKKKVLVYDSDYQLIEGKK